MYMYMGLPIYTHLCILAPQAMTSLDTSWSRTITPVTPGSGASGGALPWCELCQSAVVAVVDVVSAWELRLVWQETMGFYGTI